VRRRTLLTAVPLGLAVPVLAACGDDAAPAAGRDPRTTTVAHKFGTTEVPANPQRVVSVGLTEQDTLLQLGVVPVGVTEWYDDQPDATWPWARELLGDAHPEVLHTDNGFEYEKIAALEPDLIVGTNAGLTAKDYRLLSAIAPTVTSVKGSTQYFSAWDEQALQIARAVGREAQGRTLVDTVKQQYADAAAAHPEWAGRTATFSQGDTSSDQLYVYPDGLDTQFLSMLGFSITQGLEEYAPQEGAQAEISAENVDLIDADVVVFATESRTMFDALLEFGTVATMPAVAEGRTVYTDHDLAGAIYFITPLSLAYTLDRLVPMLEAAADGRAPRAYPA
jgi:iron complex transport system substrate-binding protein